MPAESFISQAAAIPWRRTAQGGVEVLLIRWKNEDKWGIPKGKEDFGHDLRHTAANEALEEAGVEGVLSAKPMGSFSYCKSRGGECLVEVYDLRVTTVHDSYREASHRLREWFDLPTAAEVVGRKQVRKLIVELGEMLNR
jgi:ADP-ribose pyrophosphatase YjhB (NUDIX family)